MFPKQILSFQGKRRDFIGVKKDMRQGDKQNGEAIHCLHQSRLLRRCTWHLCAMPVMLALSWILPSFASRTLPRESTTWTTQGIPRWLGFYMFLNMFLCFFQGLFALFAFASVCFQAMNQTVSEPRNSFHAWRRSVNGHWQTRSGIPTSHLCKAAKLEWKGKPIWQNSIYIYIFICQIR